MSEKTNDRVNPLKKSRGGRKKRKIAFEGKMTTSSHSSTDLGSNSKESEVSVTQKSNASDCALDIESQGVLKDEITKKSVDKTDIDESQCDEQFITNIAQNSTDSKAASLSESEKLKQCIAQKTIKSDAKASTTAKDSSDSDVEVIEVVQRGTSGSVRCSVIKVPSADTLKPCVNTLNIERTNAQALEHSQGAIKKSQKMNNMRAQETDGNSISEDKTQEVKKNKDQGKGTNNASSSKASEVKLLKRLQINEYTNFMKNFDPQRSQREARKLENFPIFAKKEVKKKQHNDKRLYDENGIYILTGQDLCDCLIEDCPGCHFPCAKCRSCKCGHMCRRNRTWCYDEIEIEGTGEIIKRKV